MKVTMRDVAKAAGVSLSTVSKVVNNHYSISVETADHVRKVMQDMNYYPNARAQNFARGTTKTVILLAGMEANTAFRNPHMFEIVAGLEESLRKRGWEPKIPGDSGCPWGSYPEGLPCGGPSSR